MKVFGIIINVLMAVATVLIFALILAAEIIQYKWMAIPWILLAAVLITIIMVASTLIWNWLIYFLKFHRVRGFVRYLTNKSAGGEQDG